MRAGFLIREIFDRFKSKIMGSLKPDRALYMYSAHGTFIVSVLNALDVFDVRHSYILSFYVIFRKCKIILN